MLLSLSLPFCLSFFIFQSILSPSLLAIPCILRFPRAPPLAVAVVTKTQFKLVQVQSYCIVLWHITLSPDFIPNQFNPFIPPAARSISPISAISHITDLPTYYVAHWHIPFHFSPHRMRATHVCHACLPARLNPPLTIISRGSNPIHLRVR